MSYRCCTLHIPLNIYRVQGLVLCSHRGIFALKKFQHNILVAESGKEEKEIIGIFFIWYKAQESTVGGSPWLLHSGSQILSISTSTTSYSPVFSFLVFLLAQSLICTLHLWQVLPDKHCTAFSCLQAWLLSDLHNFCHY